MIRKLLLSKKNAENADLSQFHQAETKTSALAEKLKGFSVDGDE
jgi:hypothetical protein